MDLAQKEWPSVPSLGQPISIADLFCGCGGLTLGVVDAAATAGRRVDVLLAIDSSKDALTVYSKNFQVSGDAIRHEDIRQSFPGMPGERLKKVERHLASKIDSLDLIVAGPPCQGHSDLNNSTRRSDPRNSLYLVAVRAAEVLRPKVVMIENVPAVIHDRKRVVNKATKLLRSFGYTVQSSIIDSSSLGLPQRRRRHLLLATFVPTATLERIGALNGSPASVRDSIADIQDEPAISEALFSTPSRMSPANKERVATLFSLGLFDLPNEYRPPCHRDKPHSYKSSYGRLRWDDVAQTITSGFGSMGQGRFVHPGRQRTLTPHEAARLQGFPDYFDFNAVHKRTALHEMIGNAVPPILASTVIRDLLFNNLL